MLITCFSEKYKGVQLDNFYKYFCFLRLVATGQLDDMSKHFKHNLNFARACSFAENKVGLILFTRSLEKCKTHCSVLYINMRMLYIWDVAGMLSKQGRGRSRKKPGGKCFVFLIIIFRI